MSVLRVIHQWWLVCAIAALPAIAADAVSLVIHSADPGVTVQPADGPARPAVPWRVVGASERVCFPKAGARVSLRRSDRAGDFDYPAPQAGCWTGAEIALSLRGSGHRSSREVVRQLRAILGIDRQGAHSPSTAAARDGANAFCRVTAYTDWLVLDQLGGLSMPVTAGTSATLTPLAPDGTPAAPPIAIGQTWGEIVLPAIGAPGQVFQLAIRGGLQDDTCTLRLRVVAGAQHSGVAPAPQASGSDAQEAAWQAAVHALRLVENHGRAWSLEAMRQIAPHRAVREAEQAHDHLARPNRTCANTESTEHPTRFDAPLLRASTSLLRAGQRSLFVAWRGGLPPFRVTLAREGDPTPIAELSELKGCEAFLPATDLTAGQYRLEIADRRSYVFPEASLLVAVKQAAPPASDGAEVATWLAQAQWLAEQDDGRWRFSALQDVAARLGELPEAEAWIARNGRPPALSPAVQ